jgi:hypothetical protein
MRRALAGLVVLLFTAAAAEPVKFPGPVTEAPAPSGGLRITYSDPGEGAEGIHQYSLRLEYPGGRSDEIDVFTRTVMVSWSPTGAALTVTDQVTDNVADCYVITPGPDKTRKISLTELLTQGRYPVPAWALQHSAHAAVTCDGWPEPDKVHFVLAGTGGDLPNGFRYAFVYDATRGIIKPDRAPSQKRKSRH